MIEKSNSYIISFGRQQLNIYDEIVEELVKYQQTNKEVILETLYELNKKPKSKTVLQWI